LQKQRQTWQEVSLAAALGDRVIIDLVGTINDQPFTNNEFKDKPVILGLDDPTFPGLDDKLIGVKLGEQREFDLTFPPEHQNVELAGNCVHLVITCKEVATPKLPSIDAEFAKIFGVADGNIETLRIEARHNMERELEYAIKTQLKRQVLNALLKANPIEAPKTLVAEETQNLLKNRDGQNQNQSVPMFEEEALWRVKIGLLIGELVNQHQIQAPTDKVRQMIDSIAFAYEDPQAVVREYYADDRRLKEIESVVLEDEVVNWLLERAQLIEKPIKFYDMVVDQEPNFSELVAS
jgi:trigger factor